MTIVGGEGGSGTTILEEITPNLKCLFQQAKWSVKLKEMSEPQIKIRSRQT